MLSQPRRSPHTSYVSFLIVFANTFTTSLKCRVFRGHPRAVCERLVRRWGSHPRRGAGLGLELWRHGGSGGRCKSNPGRLHAKEGSRQRPATFNVRPRCRGASYVTPGDGEDGRDVTFAGATPRASVPATAACDVRTPVRVAGQRESPGPHARSGCALAGQAAGGGASLRPRPSSWGPIGRASWRERV